MCELYHVIVFLPVLDTIKSSILFLNRSSVPQNHLPRPLPLKISSE